MNDVRSRRRRWSGPGDRGQSEPLGVLLLTAVVVLTVATASVAVFGHLQGTETTRVDVSVTVTHDGVGLAHDGGDDVPLSALRVAVRNDSETWEPAVDAAGVVAGDADGAFEPGERWVARRSLGDDAVTVYVVDTGTGTLLDETERYPTRLRELTHAPSDTPTPTPGATAVDTPTETRTPTAGPTATATPTATPTASPTPTAAPTPMATSTPAPPGPPGGGPPGGGAPGGSLFGPI